MGNGEEESEIKKGKKGKEKMGISFEGFFSEINLWGRGILKSDKFREEKLQKGKRK